MNKAQTKQVIKYSQKQQAKQQAVELPESWLRAAGLLQHKKEELVQHLKGVRLEWSSRPLR